MLFTYSLCDYGSVSKIQHVRVRRAKHVHRWQIIQLNDIYIFKLQFDQVRYYSCPLFEWLSCAATYQLICNDLLPDFILNHLVWREWHTCYSLVIWNQGQFVDYMSSLEFFPNPIQPPLNFPSEFVIVMKI